MAAGPVLVMGAGSVGCYLGGMLQAGGAEVRFVGRPRVLDALRKHGLRLTDLDGRRVAIGPGELSVHESPPPCAPALVLLCVKSAATADAATALAAAVAAGTPVVSMQNGIGNAALAQGVAPQLVFLPGLVGFNVAELGPGRWHRGTTGLLAAQEHPLLAGWRERFAAAGLPLALHAELRPLQWGKLLLNLNNPVNALCGLPLRAELLDADCRRVFAALVAEALAVLATAGIRPAPVGAAAPKLLPAIMRLPTPLFRVVAARLLRIDAHARSSMADDLALGRPTEIDALCGEVVRLARAHGTQAPRNARMVELLQRRPTPRLAGAELRRALSV